MLSVKNLVLPTYVNKSQPAADHAKSGPDKSVVSGPISFHAQPGERWAILGANGCGKSTLLATLAGLQAYGEAQVLVQGKRLSDWPLRELARLRAYLPQTEQQAFALPAYQRVLAARWPHSAAGWESPADWQVVQHWLAAFELSAQQQQNVLTLSGGERQRLSLAAVFAQEAPLLLLDEPTAHLDVPHSAAFFRLLKERSNDCALLVLHDLNLALHHCTHALLFSGGQVLAGPCEDILQPALLSAAFQHPFMEIRQEQRRWLLAQ